MTPQPEHKAAMLKLHEVSKSFGKKCVVDQVSLALSAQEVVGLLGANGAGKTTTMRMIVGSLAPDAGDITIDGVSVCHDPRAAQMRVGYLAEHTPLYHEMEVTDFLTFMARMRAVPRGQLRMRLDEAIEQCDLAAVVGRPIYELSKGYKQRVGIAAAVIHDPALLILDEPTSGLDPQQIYDFQQFVRKLGRTRAVLLSTHILSTIETTCDRAVILHEGKVAGQGSVAELRGGQSRSVRYQMLVNAAEHMLRERSVLLGGAQIVSCRSVNTQWQEAVIDAPEKVTGDNVFQWAVANGWQLRELKESRSSLEEAFRDMTREEMH